MRDIPDILAPLGVPIARLKYTGDAETYITYYQYNEMGELFADDAEVAKGSRWQVDIWSKTDFTALADQVLQLMTDAGFRRIYAIEFYEADSFYFHKAIRFYYFEEAI